MRWSVRRQMVTGAVALAVLLFGFGSWSVLAQIDGAVMTPGRVEVDRQRAIVQHPFGGIVSNVLVSEGDHVTKDDLLLRLDGSDLHSELAIRTGQLFEVLARRARLEAERDDADALSFDPVLLAASDSDTASLMAGQVRLFLARLATERQAVMRLGLRRSQITSQLAGISAQQTALTTQQGLIARELADQQSLLTAGLAVASRVLALQREAASLAGRAGELAAQAAQAGERMTEVEIQILALAAARREQAISDLRDLHLLQAELSEQRRILMRQIDRLDIRAPVSGTVYNMQVTTPHSVIVPAETLLFLIPRDRPLIVTTQVPATDIDQIFVGQQVILRFAAFNQRRTPELAGTVTRVSADVFDDQITGAPYYRATVQLNAGETERLPPDMILIPGMPVDAFARTGQRSPLDYFIKPLSDYFSRTLRDG